jgi:hypothetical protein
MFNIFLSRFRYLRRKKKIKSKTQYSVNLPCKNNSLLGWEIVQNEIFFFTQTLTKAFACKIGWSEIFGKCDYDKIVYCDCVMVNGLSKFRRKNIKFTTDEFLFWAFMTFFFQQFFLFSFSVIVIFQDSCNSSRIL